MNIQQRKNLRMVRAIQRVVAAAEELSDAKRAKTPYEQIGKITVGLHQQSSKPKQPFALMLYLADAPLACVLAPEGTKTSLQPAIKAVRAAIHHPTERMCSAFVIMGEELKAAIAKSTEGNS